ncbi:hypothetical protein COCVIDRAFT_88242 [Bipolaris victoriae FI3]|uniref:Mitochondrial carrier protein PET8 n=1 Tax=Bipolaris victoriae (strain FI3) TaxID=930091 RepID=W7EL84_BIPV3|nr:hypothetical protein COCVIDRAFT_88242 [Bipolaris victoriae FI3]
MVFVSQPEYPWVISPYLRSIIAGGLAGIITDLSLYPLDTLKTRLQSSAGFAASGGFNGVYHGIGSIAFGSVPGAALFFITYDSVKRKLTQQHSGCYNTEEKPCIHANNETNEASIHIAAASLGEIAACAVRAPAEAIKQRVQIGQQPSAKAALMYILNQRHARGLWQVQKELYRGWSIMITREIPFTTIQFPLWEVLKKHRQSQKKQGQISAMEGGLLGSIAGAVAAGITTPLDVLKTRITLARRKQHMYSMLLVILKETGPRGFYVGIGPRVIWIGMGGAVFLGSYQWMCNALG